MRLLQINGDGDLSLVEYFGSDIPRYAILSHTWGADDDEISFKDVKKNRARSKPSGYHKVRFCGEQALRDGIHFFWVDTCCIKQESSQEVGEAINSMYRWYHNAVTCYVYLTDVTVTNPTRQGTDSEPVWYSAFLSSKWFTRGWTLQELLAPVSIEFFSQEGDRLGDRTTLLSQIQWITKIPEAALRGTPLSTFAVEERISWARTRVTKREEDAAYSLLGLFGIHMPLIYGEGRRNALKRLQREIVNNSKEEPLSPFLSSSSVVASSTTAPHPSGNLATSVSSPADYAGRKSFSRAPTLHTVLDVRFGFRIDEIRPVFDSGLRGNSTNIRVNEGVSGKWWTCGSSIHQATVPSLVSRHFDTVTVYYESERYTVMRGDATSSPTEREADWSYLNFDHNDMDFSSSLHIHGTHPTLRCQRAGSVWPQFLFPDVYHGPFDTSSQYGGLRGSMSIFLALLALSISPDELEQVLPTLRKNGQWRWLRHQNGRTDKRGVVVYIYCSSDTETLHLQAYQNGVYGNYFD